MPGCIQGLQGWWSRRPAALRLAVEGGALLLASAVAVAAALPRIPQPSSYRSFADQRSLLGIPHALNTLSNAAIAVPGAVGVWLILRPRRGAQGRLPTAEAVCWGAACLAMMGAAAGSAYYHLQPNNERLHGTALAWCALTFASLNAGVVAERRSHMAGLLGLLPLQLVAASSVAAWQASEAAGQGDLRAYLLVEGLAVAGVAWHAVCYTSPRGTTPLPLRMLGQYALAIVGDRLDRPVYRLTLNIASGHTLKHLLAGAAGRQLVRMLRGVQRSGAKRQ